MSQEQMAKEAIIALYGKPEGEEGSTLFVQHHLEELEPSYWETILGTPTPDASGILGSLILIDSWNSADDGPIDTYDFSLPNGVTQYMLSVRFNGNTVDTVSMES